MSFHAPEKYRWIDAPAGCASDSSWGNNGAFRVPSPAGGSRELFIIASDGLGWEHVSTHAWGAGREQTPSWDEMCFVKDMFWDPEDVVIQYHPAKSQYINCHPHTLHQWRPTSGTVPVPDSILVGPPGI